MELLIVGFLGMCGGAICAFFYNEHSRRNMRISCDALVKSSKEREEEVFRKSQEYKSTLQAKLKSEYARVQLVEKKLEEKSEALSASVEELKENLKRQNEAVQVEFFQKRSQAEQYIRERELEISKRLTEVRLLQTGVERTESMWKTRMADLDLASSQISERQKALDTKVISYQDLQTENNLLKRNLRNIDLQVRKTQMDVVLQRDANQQIEVKVQEVGDTYLVDNVKWISASINANNFGLMKQRLQKVIADCREMGLVISDQRESELHAQLKALYEKAVRAAFEREEQLRIKAQIREERLREKEIEKELRQLEREREAIRVALEKALRDTRDQHSEEVERLRLRLAEAEARSQRAISQAQLTKAGYVYVISNIGSFGDGVFKVGMTRRLEPLDRVRELGDASVPFPFDVHMMISSDNAPALENALHKHLYKHQVNKINPRKEFFRASIEDIASIVKENHGEIEYIADPEALQYRQSLELSDDDVEYIEHVYDELDEQEDSETTIPDGF